MNKKRASEIVASPVMVHVTYNGDPIYIENVNSDDATAEIHSLKKPNRSQKVELSNLIEH